MIEQIHKPVWKYTCDGCAASVEIIGDGRPDGWESFMLQTEWLLLCGDCSWSKPIKELLDKVAAMHAQKLDAAR